MNANKKLKRTIDNNGYVLVITVLVTSLMLFLGIYLSSLSFMENRISHSHANAIQSYYLSEAGVEDMIFKIKNNLNGYGTSFEQNELWTTSFTRNSPFDPSTSYEVSITNTDNALGEITSAGFVALPNGNNAQRIVKITIFRALGDTILTDIGALSNGNIDISLSKVNFYNGGAFSNNNFIANLWSEVNIDGDLNVVNNFLSTWMSDVNVSGTTYAANNQPPNAPEAIEMPAVDFDSADPNSYKNLADMVYTSSQFSNLMWSNQNLTLNNPITYVSGDVVVEGGQNLTINGLLVVERDFKVGKNLCWNGRCGKNNIIVNHTLGSPSGILAKRKVEMDFLTGLVNITGIVYANDEMKISGIPFLFDFEVYGALVSRKLTITSVWQNIDIHYDSDVANNTFEPANFSPIINIKYWEEKY